MNKYFNLGLATGLLLVAILAAVFKPTTYLLAFNEDEAHVVAQFTYRGSCLVELEQLPRESYKLQCWTHKDENNH